MYITYNPGQTLLPGDGIRIALFAYDSDGKPKPHDILTIEYHDNNVVIINQCVHHSLPPIEYRQVKTH